MINHKHKFIFIHIPKCGGLSIESVFNWKSSRHDTMELYKKCNPHIDLNNYYKYTFVRNPWDRMVSWYYYHWNGKDYRGATFKDWCKNGFLTHWKGAGWKNKDPLDCQAWIVDKKEYDFIGKTENLQEGFNTVCDKIGIPRQELPHKNKSKHRHYSEYYDDETRNIVAKKYAKDIKSFGYRFGE
jgi:hypothetical protein